MADSAVGSVVNPAEHLRRDPLVRLGPELSCSVLPLVMRLATVTRLRSFADGSERSQTYA
jgi:hypothetical protein